MSERLQRYLSLVSPHWRVVVLALITSAVASILDGLTFSFLVPLLRVLLGGAPLDATAPTALDGLLERVTAGVLAHEGTLFVVLVLLVTLVALKNGFSYLSSYLAVVAEETVARDMRSSLHGAMLGLPVSFFEQVSSGEFAARILSDVDQAKQLVRHVITTLFRNVTAVVVYLTLMALISWKLTLVALVAGPVIALIVSPVVRRMRAAVAGALGHRGRMAAQHQEAVHGIRVLKSFERSRENASRFSAYAGEHLRSSLEAQRLAMLASPLTEVLAFVAVAGLILLGMRTEGMQPELFIAFLALTVRAISPIRSLSQLPAWSEQSLAARDRLLEVLDASPERKGGAVLSPGSPMAVDFKGVGVTYGEVVALNAVNLSLNPGECVAVVGESGAGKSSLVDLVPGFSRARVGRVSIDGVDLTTLDLPSHRRRVGYVGQEPFLFNATIEDNIRFGQPDASSADVAAAAREANAHAFIASFPDGYRTVVGERGGVLSGGQRQRVALARALLVSPDLLILDEATSSLDAESEKAIRESLKRLRGRMTIVVVAHRLGSVEDCDRVIVLRDGSIVEVGVPGELISGNTRFADLFRGARS